MGSISILRQGIDREDEMKKNTRRALIIILVLLVLILLCLVGFIFLQRDQKEQSKQIKKLEAEIQDLEEKRIQAVYEREDLEMKNDEMKNEPDGGKEEQESDEEPQGEPEEAAPSPEENTPVPASLAAVRENIEANIAGRTAAGEQWQAYVCRLSDQTEEMSGSGRMTAASLIKLYIMGAVYEKYDSITGQNGKERVDSLLRSMITVSDNDAANSLTVMLGQGDAASGRAVVTDYCARNGYGDSSMGRMLLETGTDRENYTSVRDCGVFLRRVYQGEMAHGEEMMSLLKQQQRRGKIPAGVPSGVVVANKTGELADVENDAAVVFKDNCPYILCVMSGNVGDTAAARQTIVNISSGVYNNMQ